MYNERIRKAAKRWGIHLWELARFCGCSESTLYRKLRTPLEFEEEEKWMSALEELAAIEPEERPWHLYGMG